MTELPPGPELDEAVARAMGRKVQESALGKWIDIDDTKFGFRGGWSNLIYNPSENVALALKEADEKFSTYTITVYNNIRFIQKSCSGTSTESIAHAICLAIIAAKEATDGEG